MDNKLNLDNFIGGKYNMKLSARNQFVGKVIEINEGAVNSVVKIELPKGQVITSTITKEAVKELELTVGCEAIAVIKATSVMISTNPNGLSARNKLNGKVVAINEGAVNSVVKVELEGGQVISSTITCEAVKELGLSVGCDVTAIVKATSVMISTPEKGLSARNKFAGKVKEINEGAVNSVVKIELPKGQVVTSTITKEAVADLGLTVGGDATAVIKATSVMISTNPNGLSARNKLNGKVVTINEGKVNDVVKVELEGGEVVSSTITCEAVKELGLSVGSDVTAIVKATEVMVMA